MQRHKANSPQRRIILFVFDGGTGVGHLRRLSTIARKLQGRFSCLIVTGHRDLADWFIPDECEYVRIPSWDSLLASKAAYWGRQPFLTLDEAEAVDFRSRLLSAIVAIYRPDAILVDHLPLGAFGELAEIIQNYDCPKYLVTRGILNESSGLKDLVLGVNAKRVLREHYKRILVACDSRVFNFSDQYQIEPELRAKTIHTGYVTEEIESLAPQRVRRKRGIRVDDLWVVASAGGGQRGEGLITECLHLAQTHKDVTFDIVEGPRSGLSWTNTQRTKFVRPNVRLHRTCEQMPLLHAAADIVISTGGYNSILETLQGKAKIICFPFWKDVRDEQYRHADSLRTFVDVSVSLDQRDLSWILAETIKSLRTGRSTDRREELAFDGSHAIEQILLHDYGMDDSPAVTSTLLEGNYVQRGSKVPL